MASAAASSLALLLIITISSIAITVYGGKIGVAYGRDPAAGDTLPSPSNVVNILKSNSVTNVRIYDVDHDVLTAFKNSGITLTVELTNEHLQDATSQSFTDDWVNQNIRPFYPDAQIDAIAVGNEVMLEKPDQLNNLVPAMRNLHTSLNNAGFGNIKLSSPFPLSVLSNAFPPSRGAFKAELIQPVLKPLLQFLVETSSYFMINIYPDLTYASGAISLAYALFDPSATPVTDQNTNLQYTNVFDAQLDALDSAMRTVIQTFGTPSNAGQGPDKTVSEGGWARAHSNSNHHGLFPASTRRTNDDVATIENAAKFNNNLVKKILNGGGTPANPNQQIDAYIFSLFDTSRGNYGLFKSNGEKYYDISFTGGGGGGGGQVWCVAKAGAPRDQLQKALDYACSSQAGADCGPIQPGANCYQPNTLEAHASWAFSSYYQKKSHSGGKCDFQGVATLVYQKPSYGGCDLPATST